MKKITGKKILLALSGGVDSVTALSLFLKEKADKIITVFFKYESKHNDFEKKAVFDVTAYYKLDPPLVVDLSGTMQYFKSSLLKSGDSIPEGSYKRTPFTITAGIPCRNMIFISYLAGIADSNDLDIVVVTPLKDTIFLDTTPRFIRGMQNIILSITERKVLLLSPFSFYYKSDVIKLGAKLKTPYHLTRSCYKEQEIACGCCTACLSRLKAFSTNGLVDPITYQK